MVWFIQITFRGKIEIVTDLLNKPDAHNVYEKTHPSTTGHKHKLCKFLHINPYVFGAKIMVMC